MNKFFFLFLTVLLLTNCSFDNKTGIWSGKDEEKKRIEEKNKQQKEIDNYLKLFGNDTKGLTRILSRVYLKNFFRSPISISK